MESWYPVLDAAAALRKAISWQRPANPIDEQDSSPINILVQQAQQTILNELPLCAIAEAYIKKAELLTAQGAQITAVYVEYCKYLNLYPHKESEEYKKICAKAYVLEQEITASFSANFHMDLNLQGNGNRGRAPALNHFVQWKLILALLIGVFVALLAQRISVA
ncbi:hypothetical protein MVEN_01573600 [Mycena venus]|uniref:Uncharacterized protein n=1 Tax=Mycena venus TaxID=2733690 RepID=A0A8H7CPN3_9AGAR|nr:hypothetical protein MVEN_01573600 [Mycena venus]